jgi:hypothetical protein
MTKKTTTTTKKTRRSMMGAHEKEIAERVIGPVMLAFLQKEPNLTLTQLTDKYNKAWSTTVSSSTVRRWLKLLGWEYTRVATWTGLPSPHTADGEEEDLDVLLTEDTAPANTGFPGPKSGAVKVGPTATRTTHGIVGT